MSKKYRIFVNRNPKSIEGLLTVMDTHTGKPVPNLEHLRIRSGQRGHTDSSWVRSKSPIPYTVEVVSTMWLWLTLSPLQPKQLDAGQAGIGEFWRIGTGSDGRVIERSDGVARRFDIGIHPENAYPGSLGCVVLPLKRQVKALSTFLWGEKLAGCDRIEVIVV